MKAKTAPEKHYASLEKGWSSANNQMCLPAAVERGPAVLLLLELYKLLTLIIETEPTY
jgi:hypothetical protein